VLTNKNTNILIDKDIAKIQEIKILFQEGSQTITGSWKKPIDQF